MILSKPSISGPGIDSAPSPEPGLDDRPVGRCDVPEHVYLHPGIHVVTADPTIITTVVGSGVALCMWDRASGAGGMCHFTLPQGARGHWASTRYGSIAIDRLLADLLHMGCLQRSLRAKLFGGASICRAPERAGAHLGIANVDFAFTVLGERSIPVEGSSVGGHRGRKVRFQTGNGSSWVKAL